MGGGLLGLNLILVCRFVKILFQVKYLTSRITVEVLTMAFGMTAGPFAQPPPEQGQVEQPKTTTRDI